MTTHLPTFLYVDFFISNGKCPEVIILAQEYVAFFTLTNTFMFILN